MNYELHLGDAVTVLKTLPANSFQVCVSSPPYFGLRSYLPSDHPDKAQEIGTEQTPEEFVAKLVEVFREVRRVLRHDGTLWLNLACSYNGSGGAGGDYGPGGLKEGQPKYPGRNLSNFKPKDMIPIPWMVAMALQQDGYYLRSEIIWHKKACMPESVADRPTRAHEQLFLLSKNAQYFYDADAIREPHQGDSGWAKQRANGVNTWDYGREGYDLSRRRAGDDPSRIAGTSGKETGEHPNGRNKRSVWTLGPENSGVEHYATMPTKLVEPCILAGSRPGDTVLDPFFGSGTTAAVALKHGRRFIGCDIDERNIELAHDRISKSQPMLFEVTA